MAAQTLTQREANKMIKNFGTFMESDACSRLVGKSTLKELIKAVNPDLRSDATLQAAVVQQVGPIVFKAIQRCLGNNRKTVKPVDM